MGLKVFVWIWRIIKLILVIFSGWIIWGIMFTNNDNPYGFIFVLVSLAIIYFIFRSFSREAPKFSKYGKIATVVILALLICYSGYLFIYARLIYR